MVRWIATTVLSLIAVCATTAPARAQGDMQRDFGEAIRLLRLGQREQALGKLEQVVAADPSNQAAFELWQRTDSMLFHLLVEEGGQFATLATDLLERARQARGELSRNEAAIAALVETATADGDTGARSVAMSRLATEHGGFAAPALLAILGDSDRSGAEVNRAILTLTRIGRPVTPALCAALKSSNDRLRHNAGAALVQLADPRSAAAFAQLAQSGGGADRYIAQRGLRAIGVAEGSSAADLYVSMARDYMEGPGAREGRQVLWVPTETRVGVSAVDVPPHILHLELAKQAAEAACRLDPANVAAQSLVVRAYLGEAAAIERYAGVEGVDEDLAGLRDTVPALRMVALASGPRVLERALGDAIASDPVPVVVEVVRALGHCADRRELAGSGLITALDHPDNRVRNAAALALVGVAGADLPVPEKVVAVLGRAVGERSLQLIKMVDADPVTLGAAVEAASNHPGVALDAVASGSESVSDPYAFPDYDVVVVGDAQPDQRRAEVIDRIRTRNPGIKILLVSADEAAQDKFGALVDAVVSGPAGGADLLRAADEALGDSLQVRRERADAVAVDAGRALRALASASVPLQPALGPLRAQLGRADAVAIHAAAALGAAGGPDSLPALLAATADPERSVELRSATAQAVGSILSRMDQVPPRSFDVLFALGQDESGSVLLRTAAITALGRGRLAPGERLKLTDALSVVAGSTGGR